MAIIKEGMRASEWHVRASSVVQLIKEPVTVVEGAQLVPSLPWYNLIFIGLCVTYPDDL